MIAHVGEYVCGCMRVGVCVSVSMVAGVCVLVYSCGCMRVGVGGCTRVGVCMLVYSCGCM